MARGRKTLFKTEIISQSERMAGFGFTETQIAYILGIRPSTLRTWKGKHPEFDAALKRGETIANSTVVESLYKRAIGYKYREVTISRSKLNPKQKVQKVTIKEIPADTTAQIFWLKNKMPEVWREKHEVVTANTPEVKVFITNIIQKAGINDGSGKANQGDNKSQTNSGRLQAYNSDQQ